MPQKAHFTRIFLFLSLSNAPVQIAAGTIVHNRGPFAAVRAPKTLQAITQNYYGIVIKPTSDFKDKSDTILIRGFHYNPDNKKKCYEARGSALLSEISDRIITCDTASLSPVSNAEYHIFAYRIDPSSRKVTSQLDTSTVLKVRPATLQQTNQLKRSQRINLNLILRLRPAENKILSLALTCVVARLAWPLKDLLHRSGQEKGKKDPLAKGPEQEQKIVLDQLPVITDAERAFYAKLEQSSPSTSQEKTIYQPLSKSEQELITRNKIETQVKAETDNQKKSLIKDLGQIISTHKLPIIIDKALDGYRKKLERSYQAEKRKLAIMFLDNQNKKGFLRFLYEIFVQKSPIVEGTDAYEEYEKALSILNAQHKKLLSQADSPEEIMDICEEALKNNYTDKDSPDYKNARFQIGRAGKKPL